MQKSLRSCGPHPNVHDDAELDAAELSNRRAKRLDLREESPMPRTRAHDQHTSEAMQTIAVIIPTLNEERSIGKVIDDVPVADLLENGLKPFVYVIDGQSTDNTREIAVEKGATIILEERQGKGSAIQTAFKSITADYAIMVDGDDTYPIEMATEITCLLKKYDVVIGSRLKGTIEPGAMTKLNVAGNVLLSLLARLLFNVQISDVCSGLWGYRGRVIRSLELSAAGFAIEVDMLAECARNGFHIAEIPITYRARGENPAKLSSVKDGLRIGTFLIKKFLSQKKAREKYGIHSRDFNVAPFEAEVEWLDRLKELIVDVLMQPVMLGGVALYVFALWLCERNSQAVP